MRTIWECPLAAGLAGVLLLGAANAAGAQYFPGRGTDWERRTPEDVGMNGDLLTEAIDFANAHETRRDTDDPGNLIRRIQDTRIQRQETHTEIIGPVKNRGPVTGVILKDGYIVAAWGAPERVDMIFSASKSFISLMFGVAYDQGLIHDVDDYVRDYVPDGWASSEYIAAGEPGAGYSRFSGTQERRPLFDSPRNMRIRWDHLLRHTSEWEGVLFGKPHSFNQWARRNPSTLPLQEPGTFYQYNNVRVNVLALSLLRVWRTPLPVVLREHIMDPIGASRAWEWHGYENSWVTIDGQRMQSIAGGGNWGGGVWMNAWDMARVGLLFARYGHWNERELLSDEFLDMATTPTEVAPGNRGFMNFGLNTDGRYAYMPRTVVWHSGAGVNRIFSDPESDLVVVVRWIDDWDGFMERVYAALGSDSTVP